MGWSPGEVTTREGVTLSIEGSSGMVEVTIISDDRPDEHLHLDLELAEVLAEYLRLAVSYVRY